MNTLGSVAMLEQRVVSWKSLTYKRVGVCIAYLQVWLTDTTLAGWRLGSISQAEQELKWYQLAWDTRATTSHALAKQKILFFLMDLQAFDRPDHALGLSLECFCGDE